MDYLEGFLIGSVWTDTDYETKRHTAIHILLAFLVAAWYIFLQVFATKQTIMARIPWPYSLIIFIILMLVTPIIACFYYRLPLYARVLVLTVYAIKYLLGAWVLIQLTLPIITIDTASLQDILFEEINHNIEVAIGWFSFMDYLFSMILGIIVGGLWLVLKLLFFLLVIMAVPLMVLLLIKLVQYGLDRAVARVFSVR
ncbi:MAG TPA: hypothetical protein GXZ59_01980 [Clostridiaceae bacterium]|nr:hypothetical protein [Clostridiaceae bacterium]